MQKLNWAQKSKEKKMNSNLVLIFDKRVEISNKYKKILEQNHSAKVIITANSDDFFENINSKEPDMLLISESTGENLSELCKNIREKELQFRPVIILLSKSSFPEDRTNALNSGADDFLSEPISSDEFLARINAHLRRTAEENETELSKLPDENYTKKIIRRTIKHASGWSMLLVGFDNFNFYREIYGELAANKLLQAYGAILDASLEHDDFIGQVAPDSFLVITSSYKAEKLADYLNYTFDSIVEKFYSPEDAKRGFILMQGDKKAGCKIPLMRTSIGIINSELISYINEVEVINALNKVQKLAKMISGSSKITDRPLITSEESIKPLSSKSIAVIEKDEDLAYLLETTLRLQGFEPEIYNDIVSAEEILKSSPVVIIIDGLDDENNSSEKLCSELREKITSNIKIIFTDTRYRKEQILSAGADLYLPKPYDLTELFSWIYKLTD